MYAIRHDVGGLTFADVQVQMQFGSADRTTYQADAI